VGSYPLDSVGLVRAANELKLSVKMFGGGMVGLQATALKMQLGPLLNGIVNFDQWLPVGSLASPDALELLKKYQSRAAAEGVDPLGYYTVPSAYAQIQLLGQAVAATGSLDQGKIAEYLRTTTHQTMVGSFKFGSDGEWAQSRLLFVQFHGITGNTVDQFREMNTQDCDRPGGVQIGGADLSVHRRPQVGRPVWREGRHFGGQVTGARVAAGVSRLAEPVSRPPTWPLASS